MLEPLRDISAENRPMFIFQGSRGIFCYSITIIIILTTFTLSYNLWRDQLPSVLFKSISIYYVSSLFLDLPVLRPYVFCYSLFFFITGTLTSFIYLLMLIPVLLYKMILITIKHGIFCDIFKCVTAETQ